MTKQAKEKAVDTYSLWCGLDLLHQGYEIHMLTDSKDWSERLNIVNRMIDTVEMIVKHDKE